MAVKQTEKEVAQVSAHDLSMGLHSAFNRWLYVRRVSGVRCECPLDLSLRAVIIILIGGVNIFKHDM